MPESRQIYVYHTPRAATVLEASETLSTPLLPDWSVSVGDVLPNVTDAYEANSDEITE